MKVVSTNCKVFMVKFLKIYVVYLLDGCMDLVDTWTDVR